MLQTLDLPLLSLAVPNVQKLNDINADSLSCMWTVFSKCKDNLENGRRLENMSWRLWYRESTFKEASKQQPSITPIPIQSSVPLNTAERSLTPASFTQIISTLNKNDIVAPSTTVTSTAATKPDPVVLSLTETKPDNHQRHSKFFIREDDESETDESEWSSEEEDSDCDDDEKEEKHIRVQNERAFFGATLTDMHEPLEVLPADNLNNMNEKDHSADSDDDYETMDEDEDEDEEVAVPQVNHTFTFFGDLKPPQQQNTKVDEIAFQREFKKRSPAINNRMQTYSLLSSLFRTQVAPDQIKRLHLQ